MFPINRIIVTAEREEHIWTKHAVTREDVDDICFSDPLIRRGREGSYGIYGQTSGGRYLIAFIYPISQGVFRLATARDMNEAERRRYQRYRKG